MADQVISTQLFAHDQNTAAQRAEGLWRELQDVLGERYDVLGWLGYDRVGNHMYLARDRERVQLVGVRLAAIDPDPQGREQYRSSVLPRFDPNLLELGGVCSSCGKRITGWESECATCGAPPGVVGEDSSAIEGRARRGVAGKYEVIGAVPRAAELPLVYFGREFATGRLVALRFKAVDTGGGALELTGVTMLTPVSHSPHSGPVGPLDHGLSYPPGTAARKVCPKCERVYPADANFCPNDQNELVLEGQAEPLVGTVIGNRYKVLRRLGAGGMGRVYLAEHISFGRRDAVKIMAPGLATNAEAVRRFRREAENASRVKHRNCAMIYDFGETGSGSYYIAMEFVDGQSLAELVVEQGTMPLERVIGLTLQICDALHAAHSLEPSVVHRDLKPDNVMVTTEGGAELVKVVDFGIAKAVQGQSLSAPGLLIGTPAYMSPEQLVGDPVDPRSDIYSLGCILYELCTGRRAYSGLTIEEITFQKLQGKPPRLAMLRPELPRELEAIIDKALARSPGDRYGTVAGFRDAVRQLKPLPAGSIAAPPTRRWPSTAGRRAVMLGGSLLAAVILAYAIPKLIDDRSGSAAKATADSLAVRNREREQAVQQERERQDSIRRERGRQDSIRQAREQAAKQERERQDSIRREREHQDSIKRAEEEARKPLKLGPAGGAGGNLFSDICEDYVRGIRVRAGYWIDAVQLICRSGSQPLRGGAGGTEQTFWLRPGEYVTAIRGSALAPNLPYVFSLQIRTTYRSSPVYGNGGPTKGSVPFAFVVPAGRRFAGLWGKSSRSVDALGVVTLGR
jgi:serine/threonine protein kinase